MSKKLGLAPEANLLKSSAAIGGIADTDDLVSSGSSVETDPIETLAEPEISQRSEPLT